MNNFTEEFKQSAEKSLLHLREDLKSIRTGRATPALLENLTIEAYGGTTKMPLSSLATISTEGIAALRITPFDQSVLQEIEKAVLKSTLSLSPRVQGTTILVTIPPLSEEQREKFVKLVGTMIEETRVALRNARDEVRRKIRVAEDKKEITEDGKFRSEKEIDTVNQKYLSDVQSLKEKKEADIRQV